MHHDEIIESFPRENLPNRKLRYSINNNQAFSVNKLFDSDLRQLQFMLQCQLSRNLSKYTDPFAIFQVLRSFVTERHRRKWQWNDKRIVQNSLAFDTNGAGNARKRRSMKVGFVSVASNQQQQQDHYKPFDTKSSFSIHLYTFTSPPLRVVEQESTSNFRSITNHHGRFIQQNEIASPIAADCPQRLVQFHCSSR